MRVRFSVRVWARVRVRIRVRVTWHGVHTSLNLLPKQWVRIYLLFEQTLRVLGNGCSLLAFPLFILIDRKVSQHNRSLGVFDQPLCILRLWVKVRVRVT